VQFNGLKKTARKTELNVCVCYSLSELRGPVCERRLERTVLRPALLSAKTSQFTQFFRQVWRHTVKSLSLTESVERPLQLRYIRTEYGGRSTSQPTVLPATTEKCQFIQRAKHEDKVCFRILLNPNW